MSVKLESSYNYLLVIETQMDFWINPPINTSVTFEPELESFHTWHFVICKEINANGNTTELATFSYYMKHLIRCLEDFPDKMGQFYRVPTTFFPTLPELHSKVYQSLTKSDDYYKYKEMYDNVFIDHFWEYTQFTRKS